MRISDWSSDVCSSDLAVDIPVIGDADTGHGNALNAQHAMRAFERAGLAGCHLEDQVFPKRCGHYDAQAIVSQADLAQNILALKDASHDPDFVLLPLTAALALHVLGRVSLMSGLWHSG